MRIEYEGWQVEHASDGGTSLGPVIALESVRRMGGALLPVGGD